MITPLNLFSEYELMTDEKISQQSYANDPALIVAVRDCENKRLTYKEAVSCLNQKGFKINGKKFQRVKAFIKKIDDQQLTQSEINISNLSISHRLETHDSIVAVLWQIIKDTKYEWAKIAAAKLIMENEKEKDEFVRKYNIRETIARQTLENANCNDGSQSTSLGL